MGRRIVAQLPWLLVFLLAGACDTAGGGGGGAAGAEGAGGALAGAAGSGEGDAQSDGVGMGSETGQPDASGPGTEPPSHQDAAEHIDEPFAETPTPPAGGTPTDDMSGVEPPPDDAPDPMTAPTADGTGSAGTGGDSTGVDSGCELGKTRTHLGNRPVQEGELCDDVVVCVDDALGAAAITAVAPHFECDSGENPVGLCAPGQQACIWRPSVLDADEAASVCAVTTVLPDAGELVCVVYL